MKIEDAMLIARYGRTFGVFGTPARKRLRNEAIEVLKARAEELMKEADAQAMPSDLIDIQVYENTPYRSTHVWVKRTFSNGTITKVAEPRISAMQIKYSFDAGRKAGANQACAPRTEDFV